MVVFFLFSYYLYRKYNKYGRRQKEPFETKSQSSELHKGNRPHIPSQTTGCAKIQINTESAKQELFIMKGCSLFSVSDVSVKHLLLTICLLNI